MTREAYDLEVSYEDEWKSYDERAGPFDTLHDLLKWVSAETAYGVTKRDTRIVKKEIEEKTVVETVEKDVVAEERYND